MKERIRILQLAQQTSHLNIDEEALRDLAPNSSED
jgi:hypothetical protein